MLYKNILPFLVFFASLHILHIKKKKKKKGFKESAKWMFYKVNKYISLPSLSDVIKLIS